MLNNLFSKQVKHGINKPVGEDLNLYDYVLYISKKVNTQLRDDIVRRANYFLADKRPMIVDSFKGLPRRVNKFILYCSCNKDNEVKGIDSTLSKYNINHLEDPFANWYWHIVNDALDQDHLFNIELNKYLYNLKIKELKQRKLNKVYIFGTGPSLRKYHLYDYSDGYKVVCNTIVRDKATMDYIKPDIIVAADAIYHYGITRYSQAFRSDLAKRLLDNPDLVFICPLIYYNFMARFIPRSQMIGIPGGDKKHLETDLLNNFYLSNLGNIMTLMLLPIAFSMSKNIYLIGFDGKKPGDKLFWSHSNVHNYPEFMEEIHATQKAFFAHHFPKNDTNKYINENLGDDLEKMFTIVEKQGFSIHMMHESYTPALSRRFKN